MKKTKQDLINIAIDLFINNCYYKPKKSYLIDEVEKRVELSEKTEKEISDMLQKKYGNYYKLMINN